ncbi:hypothetical protein AAFF_G00322440 [Aldrovandia affinis]|uniref:Protocadherin gamma-C3 n=1 Tax=Aldrovandia affinis TaxID=143900 RepID=A0AAD7WQH0_9TELE|nr:hypothetical protein AAFF_G00322440 [Aldrovandia affinis]
MITTHPDGSWSYSKSTQQYDVCFSSDTLKSDVVVFPAGFPPADAELISINGADTFKRNQTLPNSEKGGGSEKEGAGGEPVKFRLAKDQGGVCQAAGAAVLSWSCRPASLQREEETCTSPQSGGKQGAGLSFLINSPSLPPAAVCDPERQRCFLSQRDEYQLDISESTLPGARFRIESAQDPDDAPNSIRLYRLSPNEQFALDSKKPSPNSKMIELVLKKALDREQIPFHQLILTAIDSGTPARTGTAKINVRVLDSNDNVPVFDSSVYKVKLLENSPKDTLVIKLNATDADEGTNGEVIYSFSSYTPERVRQVFSMDPNTGDIRVRSPVDYEETSSYEMYVQAMDKGASAVAVHCKVVVEVVDVNDNVPEIVLSSLSSPVREDARADTVVALISVADRDSGPNKQVSLEIPPGLPFKVKSFRNYYTLVTSAFLDRETTSAYNVTLSATDSGTPPLSSKKTIQVDVADVNDNPPRFEQTSYTVYVMENNAPQASLCTVRAQDADINENGRITYTVLNDNNHGIPVTSYVSIRPDTGEAYALRSFDYETLREFHFQVKAQDAGIPP